MKIHKRESIVSDAERELRQAVIDITQKHKLTGGEDLRVVNKVFSDWIGGVAKYWIREERHGNSDTPGGLE